MLFSEVKTNEELAGRVAGLIQEVEELRAKLAAAQPSANVKDDSIDEIFDKLNNTIKEKESRIQYLEESLAEYRDPSDKISVLDYARYRRRIKEGNEKAIRAAKAVIKQLKAELEEAKAERGVKQAEAVVEKAPNPESMAKLEEAKVVLEKAQARIKEQNEELKIAKYDLETFLKDTKIHAYVFEDIIFPEFQHFGALNNEVADKVNQVKFSQAVKAAKKKDADYQKAMTKYNKSKKGSEPVQPDDSYERIVERATVAVANYLDTLSKWPTGKAMVDNFRNKYSEYQTAESIVERIIEEKSKWNIKSMLTTREGLSVLIPAGAFVALGLFAAGAAINTTGELKTTNTIRATETTVSGTSLETVENNSREIFNDLDQANLINNVWGKDATPEGREIAKTLSARDVEENNLAKGYNAVNTAATKAEKIINYLEDGTINPNCAYAQAKAAYLDATSSKNTKEAEKHAQTLNGYINTLNELKENTTKGLNEMITASNTSTQELQDILVILINPTATVEFNANTLKQYGQYLSNPAKGGKATAVLSNAYTRDTGDVTILVECLDGKGNTYYNLVQYQLDAKLINMTVADMMEPLAKGKVSAKITSFDKDLVTENNGSVIQMSTSEGKTVSGLSSFTYTITASYNEKSDLTRITAKALMLVTDAEGNVIGTNTVIVSNNHAGKVSSASKEAEYKAELIKQVNQLCGENVSEDIVELF